MQEGHGGSVCFPVLFVLGALMSDRNLGGCRRISRSWGAGQKAPLHLTCAKDNWAPKSKRLLLLEEDQSHSDTSL